MFTYTCIMFSVHTAKAISLAIPMCCMYAIIYRKYNKIINHYVTMHSYIMDSVGRESVVPKKK